jgi:hypothetical protein
LAQPRQLLRALLAVHRHQRLVKQKDAAMDRQQACHGFEQGRLARAVGAHDAGPASCCKGQVNAMQDLMTGKRHMHIVQVHGYFLNGRALTEIARHRH